MAHLLPYLVKCRQQSSPADAGTSRGRGTSRKDLPMHPHDSGIPAVESAEEWRSVPEFPNYEVSSLGRVRRTVDQPGILRYRAGHILKGAANTDGRLQVELRCGMRERTVQIHRLVAEVFLGPCPPGIEVNHRDGDKRHNATANLEYVTRAENMRHAVMHGLHGPVKITPAAVLEIRGYAQAPRERGVRAMLARKYGVSPALIRNIWLGTAWRWVTEDHVRSHPMPTKPVNAVAEKDT